MTINALATYQGPYYPNGITKNFPFAEFEVVDTDTVLAVLDGVELDPATFYVSLNDDGTGEVVFFTAPAGDGLTNELFLYSNPDFRQQSTLANQGPYYQETIEKIVDRLTVATIWLRDRVLRSPVPPVPVGDAAGKFPVVLPDGTWGFASGTGADDGLRTDLASSIGATLIAWTRIATGAVTRPLTSKLFGYVDVEDFGAVGNGLVDDTVAWTRAINFVKTRGLKLRAMSTSYLVSTLDFDGSGYHIATTAGNLFKQTPGLTGDGGVYPIWRITGSNIKFGDASFEGNIATDVDEFSHAVMIFSAKNIETGVLHGKDIRGDVVYVYGRISSEAEMSRGIHIKGVTGDNVLRCILAVSGGEGRCGFVRRTGSGRVGYKDADFEPNLVTGTSGDYQHVNFTVGHVWGATVQCVSADPDIQNYRVALESADLDGSRILNSNPGYSAHPGANDFAISVDDVMSFDGGDLRIFNYPYTPIKLGKKVGLFSYRTLIFGNCASLGSPTDPYKSIIVHLGTDPVGTLQLGQTTGTLFSNTRMVLFGAGMPLNLDTGRFDITGGLFGAYLSGRVAGIKIDCGNANGEIAFNVCPGLEVGQTVVTNAALTIGFNQCDGMILKNWTATFGTLDYLGGSTAIFAINCAINGSTADGVNILTTGNFRISDKVVAGPEGAAIADHGLAAGANPTKAEYDGLVAKVNTLFAQRRAGTTRQAP